MKKMNMLLGLMILILVIMGGAMNASASGFTSDDVITAGQADGLVNSKFVADEAENEVEVFYDADGDAVLSNLPVPYVASPETRMRQNKALNYILQNEDQILNDANILTRSRRVDYEYYPIYIGTWKGQACYARHTIGDYLSDGHLITYGYASWYNTSGYNALPYRNGAANNGSGQGVVDVARYSSFAIRDLDTNIGYTLTVNDWGPDQYRHPDRIADLDKNIFRNMHGNTSAGLLYCRTWVALTNYNP